MTFDHGELNIPLTGKRGRALDAEITRQVHAQQRERLSREQAASKARREAEAARVWFTRDQIIGARVVRLKGLGWQPVIRVNAKTVTIPGVLDPIRVPFRGVLEVRK